MVVEAVRRQLGLHASLRAWLQADGPQGGEPLQQQHFRLFQETDASLLSLQKAHTSLATRGFGLGSCSLHPSVSSSNALAARVPAVAAAAADGDSGATAAGAAAEKETPYKCLEFPLFGSFRVREMGAPQNVSAASPQRLLLPVDISAAAGAVSSVEEAVLRLRAAVDACALLENQKETLRHSYAFRFQLLTHLFLKVRPLRFRG